MAEFILFIVILVAGSLLYTSFKTGISPMPSSSKEKNALFDALPEKTAGPILDLGSGWGTLTFPLAKKYPHCQIIGYELSPVPWIYSTLKQKLLGPKNLTFKRKDFFKEPIPKATLVTLFLFPEAMTKLATLLKKELPKGALIISNTFALPDTTPTQIIEIDNLLGSKIYLYYI